MKKRVFSLILSAVMLFAISSCGDGSAKTESAATTVGDGDTSTPENPFGLAKANYDGYTFNIFGERQTTLSDYYDVEEETGDTIDDNVFRRNREVEELYNVDIEFSLSGWPDGIEKIRTYIMAGDNTYDLYTCTHLYMGPALVSNLFVDWKMVDSVDLSRDCYVQKANETYSIGDSTPLLFGDFMESNILRCWNFVFNKRLVEQYKLENPYELVDSGKWTVDKLAQMIKNTAKDLDGDSNLTDKDFYGFATDTLATLDAFTRALELNAISKDENNLPVLSYWGEHVPEAFEKVYNLYWNTPDTFATKTSLAHIDTMFAVGNAIFASGRIDLLMNASMRDMKDDYGVLPYPKRTEGQKNYATYLSGTFSAQMIGVSQDPNSWARTGTITQALNVLGHEYVIPAIYDVTLKTKTSRDEDSIRMMDLILDNRAYSFDSCDESEFPLSPYSTIRKLIGGSKSADIASHYESVKVQAEEWIQNMIEVYEDAQ